MGDGVRRSRYSQNSSNRFGMEMTFGFLRNPVVRPLELIVLSRLVLILHTRLPTACLHAAVRAHDALFQGVRSEVCIDRVSGFKVQLRVLIRRTFMTVMFLLVRRRFRHGG